MEHSEIDTRQRLLEAATEIFAEKGFEGTRVAEICARANANIALVNYHFGDKESLYNCVWRHAFDCARTEYPLMDGASAEKSAEQRLKTIIRAILSRIFADGPAACFPRLLVHEMANPSGSLPAIAEEAIRPQIEYVSQIVAELLGPTADEDTVRDCAASTLSQCFMLNCGQKIAETVYKGNLPSRHDLDSITEHIFTFSQAGIAAVRRDLEKR